MTLVTCMLTKILLCLLIFLFAWILKDGVFLVGEIRSTGQPMISTVVRNKALLEMLDHEKERAQKRLSDMGAVLAQNSDPLPDRATNQTADEMCKATKECAPKFLQLETRVRIAPNHKMVNCIVQKSMSTVMTAVMCYLYNELEFLQTGRSFMEEWSRFRFCMDKNEYNSISAVKEKLGLKNATGWSYTMVTRDPVERFISGFVDRCIRLRKPLGGKPCNGCNYNLTCFVEKEYARMMGQVREGHLKRSFEDVHLFPQNWRCELQNEYKNYEFIRYATADPSLFINDLLKVAEKQNVTKVSQDFMKSQIMESKTVHVTADSPARKYLEERLRKSPYLMEYVVKMFYQDFRLFHYNFPKGF